MKSFLHLGLRLIKDGLDQSKDCVVEKKKNKAVLMGANIQLESEPSYHPDLQILLS